MPTSVGRGHVPADREAVDAGMNEFVCGRWFLHEIATTGVRTGLAMTN